MTTLPKTLLTISVVGFAISLTGPGGEFAAGMIKPISAICFILFYIAQLLAKEAEAYDQEEQAKLGWMHRGAEPSPRAATGARSRSGRHSPTLAGVGSK